MSTRKEDVTIYIEDLVKRMSGPADYKPTIFSVDDRLREVNKKDYEPKIVSIGPIHHDENDRVKSMEQHKVRFLQELLEEIKDLTIDKLVEKLMVLEPEARRCYPRSITLDPKEFFGILLVDGCFIIQLIRKYFSGISKDPILEPETLVQIIHDLLLFENQIPFSVLSLLFDLIKTGNPDDNLRNLILFLVEDIVPWLDVSKLNPKIVPTHLLGLVYQCIPTKVPPKLTSPWYTLFYPKHVLGLIYRFTLIIISLITLVIKLIIQLIMYLYRGKQRNPREKGKKSSAHINSASELKEIAGIELKVSEDDNITFAGKVLKLPSLEVSVETESLLRNIMAYEQLQLKNDHQKHLIDYVLFLRCLIRSAKDIEILRYSGIIKNYLGSDEKMLKMFDQLGTNFMRSSKFTYSDVFASLNTHCANRQNEWNASWKRTYFNGPWSFAKFLAATLLLLLAAAQTIFTIVSYVHRKT